MLLAEEGGRRREQSLPGRDLQVDQPGERQVDLRDLCEVDLLTEPPESDEFVLGEHERSRLPERAPLLAVELDVRARFVQTAHRHVFPAMRGAVSTGSHG